MTLRTPTKSATVRAARAALDALGVPTQDGGNWSARSLFEISGESGRCAPDGLPWTDYYLGHGEFGVHTKLAAELRKHGLFAEWINPGVLGVYYA